MTDSGRVFSHVKILYVSQNWLADPDSGQKQFTFNLLKYMTRRHSCDLLCFFAPGNDADPARMRAALPGLNLLGSYPEVAGRALWEGRLRCALRGEPPSLARYRSPDFA